MYIYFGNLCIKEENRVVREEKRATGLIKEGNISEA